MKAISIKLSKNSFQIALIILWLLTISILDLFSDILPSAYGYVDECFTLLFFFLLLFNIMFLYKINKYFLLIVVLLVIGFLGNVFSGVQTNLYVVVADAFLFAKPYIIYFYIYSCVEAHNTEKIQKALTVVAKTMLILLFLSAVISRFLLILSIDVGTYSAVDSFCFYSGFGGSVANWTMLFLAIIYTDKQNKRLFYYIISFVVIIMSKSGLAIMTMVLLCLVHILIERHKRFRWYYLLFILPICIWVGRNEIMSYLLNINAPRYLLFYNALKTASEYFPFGSGFATYASTMSIQNYSKLYIKYGFNKRFGMSQSYAGFLMDSYYPQIIGQLGYIGTALFVWFMCYICFKVVFKIKNNNIFCACLWLFISWCASGLGFTSGVWGGAVFCMIALWALQDKYLYSTRKV